MELTQAVDAIPDTNTVSTAFGLTPTMIFWGIIAIVAIALFIWAAIKYSETKKLGTGESFQGAKGGKVKRTVTEYEEETI